MKNQSSITRRGLFKSSVFGFLTLTFPNLIYARQSTLYHLEGQGDNKKNHRYPSIDDELVADVVGSSHFNLEHVKELVNHRPELARANWDWSFGDWESALGAASHVGRRDIAEFLINRGARPNIFTFAMFGNLEVVKSMLSAMPHLKYTEGPHGINLLQHARAGLRSDNLTASQEVNSHKLVAYLEEVFSAYVGPTNMEMSEAEKEKYLGDYRYGDGEKDGFSVKLNMRKMLSFGKLGKFGGGLYQKAPNVFSYNGVSSVEIKFEVVENKVLSLSVHEPDLVLKAVKDPT